MAFYVKNGTVIDSCILVPMDQSKSVQVSFKGVHRRSATNISSKQNNHEKQISGSKSIRIPNQGSSIKFQDFVLTNKEIKENLIEFDQTAHRVYARMENEVEISHDVCVYSTSEYKS